jgi:hypothetical protein
MCRQRPCLRCKKLDRVDLCQNRVVGAAKVSTRRRRVIPASGGPSTNATSSTSVEEEEDGGAQVNEVKETKYPSSKPLLPSGVAHDISYAPLFYLPQGELANFKTNMIRSHNIRASATDDTNIDSSFQMKKNTHRRNDSPSSSALSPTSSSSSSEMVRSVSPSSSRSPARKRDRRFSPSRFTDETNSTLTVWSPRHLTSIVPKSLMPIFDESMVVRFAMKALRPWVNMALANNLQLTPRAPE